MFQIGENVVNVKGPSTAGDFDLQAQRGRWVVLYFYPKDNTSACTIEARDFTAAVPQFEALNAKVIGVSRDSVKTHEGFCARQELGIELGKPCRGIVRSTFLIDPQGKLAFEWRGVKVPGHVEAVLEKIRELS